MPSSSPSPIKRPSMAERTSSTHSLSSSGKQNAPHKVHRVSRHSRNVSYGKGLAKLGKINSTANMAAEGRNHARKKSGPVTPAHSPKTPVSPHMKRNSSHVTLPKNTSQGNLRKNQSATALAAGRTSSTNLKKLGAPLSQKQNDEHKKGFFELGNHSSDEEDEGEWEDSTTQSPELSRNHSKASTPLRSRTPNNDAAQRNVEREHLTSPPTTEITTPNRSLPNLRKVAILSGEQKLADPALLHNQSRATRAPPAMSTISARVQSNETRQPPTRLQRVPSTTGDANAGMIGTASGSASQGVSHFLPSSSAATSHKSFKDESEDEDTAEFMTNYKPQTSESPEDGKSSSKARASAVPSRTQQRLELQRREMMRAAATTPAIPTTPTLGLSAGSSVSLHSRSGSKGRVRSMVGGPKFLQQDYEASVKQLLVVRRFKNPILESLNRLQVQHEHSSEISSTASLPAPGKSRPQSRRGPSNVNGAVRIGDSHSPEDKKSSLQFSRAGNRNQGARVQFQMARQGSHDDIMTAQGSPGDSDDEQDGTSPEEALIRRIWESQIVYEADGIQSANGQGYGNTPTKAYPP